MLTGIGGQGVQLAAQILARAAVAEGREVMVLGTYGGTMRGGSTDSTIVVGDERIRTPPLVSEVGCALAMHHAFFAPVAAKLREDAIVVVNTSVFEGAVEAVGHRLRVFPVEATRIAADLGHPVGGALVLLAAFAALTGLVSLAGLLAGMRESVPAYRQQHVESNEKALREGFGALPPGAASLALAPAEARA